MAVYYKFKSAKDYDTVPVEGHFISVVQLKERIVEKMRLGRQPDFDLLISNAQTNEEYTEDGFLVPKNTSVLVRRVPGSIRMPIVADNKPDQKFVEQTVPASIEAPPKTNANSSDWGDDFGVDLYEEPETARAQALQTHAPAPLSTAKMDEEAKIKAFCDSSASEWQRQTQEAYVGGRGLGRGGGQGRGAGRGIGLMRKTPPDGYVCHRCNKPGHYIQHCPTNGDPNYNIKKVKLPTGIPRTMLVANPDGSYAMPNGEIAVLKPNEEVFEKEVDALTSNKVVNDVPSELRCPLCKEVLKDAVLTSRCCFKSYCDRCIRNEIITKGRCVCGATHVLADDLLPNKTLRDAIDRLLEANAATSSADNAGSKLNVPDMESALPCVKAPSPAASGSLQLILTAPDGQKAAPEVKDSGVVPEKIVDWSVQSDGLEVESLATKEPPIQDGNSNFNSKADEEGQQQQSAGQPVKKNKVKRLRPPKQMMPGAGQQMPWRGMPPEAMEEGHMMGYGGNPPPYNAFWPPHPMGEGYPMPMGDGYMMPYGGPYNGYGVPYEMQFNGAPMMPDPYAYQGMVPPVPPYPQREYMEYGPGFDYNYGTGRPNSGVMSREEFEAKKAEARRKHASEHHGREHPGDEHNSPARAEQEASKVRKRPRSTDRTYDHRESTREHRENSREHRESSRDRRARAGYGADRSTRNHGDGHSSGDDVSSDPYGRTKHGHKVEQSELADSHGTSHRAKTGSQAGPSYRSAYEDSKRKKAVTEADDLYEDSKHSSRSHSSKRMSVFHRVKQGEEDGGAADSDSSARKKSRSHAHHQHRSVSERSHHRHENHHHNHVENDNEPLKSVFNRIAYTNSKSHPKKQSAQG